MIVSRGYGRDKENLGSIVLFGYGRKPLLIAVLIVRNLIVWITESVMLTVKKQQ